MLRLSIACLALAIALAHAADECRAADPADSTRNEFVAATLNIWHDAQDWPARMTVIRDTLRALRPDVLLLQEVLQKEGLPNQAATLAESLGYTWMFVSVDPPEAPKRYGNAILTPHPILATHEVKLAPLNDYRVAGHARLQLGDRTLDVVVTHLHHTEQGDSIRMSQVEGLLAFIDTTCVPGGALLVGGDFNAAPHWPELKPIQDRLVDSWAFVHSGEGDSTITTLNVAKGLPSRRIDYLFLGPDHLRTVASEIFLDAPTADGVWGSDHFGVWTRFRWVE
jgi:beta-glucosidase